MATPLQGTDSAANAISRVHYTHDAMIDVMITSPMCSQNDLARHFGYTVGWVSRVINSDAFQARLALRKEEIIDPVLTASIEERLRGLATVSMDVLMRKLEASNAKEETALKALEISAKSLGYGVRKDNVSVQNSFVVALPGVAADANQWAAAHSGRGAGVVGGNPYPAIDVPPPSLKITDLISAEVPG